MTDLAGYFDRPLAFFFCYVRRRPAMHLGLYLSVVAGAVCQISRQYGIKFLVDIMALGHAGGSQIWLAFAFLISTIAGDHLFWRMGAQFGARIIVKVTGDLRQDLFRYVTGH